MGDRSAVVCHWVLQWCVVTTAVTPFGIVNATVLLLLGRRQLLLLVGHHDGITPFKSETIYSFCVADKLLLES
jgi:hypothetical protein